MAIVQKNTWWPWAYITCICAKYRICIHLNVVSDDIPKQTHGWPCWPQPSRVVCLLLEFIHLHNLLSLSLSVSDPYCFNFFLLVNTVLNIVACAFLCVSRYKEEMMFVVDLPHRFPMLSVGYSLRKTGCFLILIMFLQVWRSIAFFSLCHCQMVTHRQCKTHPWLICL